MKTSKKTYIIENTKEAFKNYNINILSYFKVKKDSVYFYRFYFNKKDTLLTIKILSITSPQKFSLSGHHFFLIELFMRLKLKLIVLDSLK